MAQNLLEDRYSHKFLRAKKTSRLMNEAEASVGYRDATLGPIESQPCHFPRPSGVPNLTTKKPSPVQRNSAFAQEMVDSCRITTENVQIIQIYSPHAPSVSLS